MGGPTIFQYRDYADYLQAAGRYRLSRGGRPLTYAQWAKVLGYRSPRGIAMVLQKKRMPSSDMIQRVSQKVRHSEQEHCYFEKLVDLEAARRAGADTAALERELAYLNPKQDASLAISPSQFGAISQWFCYVLKQMIDASGFREDYGWIRGRLRNKVSVVEIRMAIRVLQEVGLLARDAAGKLQVIAKRVRTTQDVADAGLREHHRQMLERAKEALQEQPVDAREFLGLTLRFSPDALPRVKERLRDFVTQFDKEFENLSSDRVYQLNIQFFEHTEAK